MKRGSLIALGHLGIVLMPPWMIAMMMLTGGYSRHEIWKLYAYGFAPVVPIWVLLGLGLRVNRLPGVWANVDGFALAAGYLAFLAVVVWPLLWGVWFPRQGA